jgi:hypothetical protein
MQINRISLKKVAGTGKNVKYFLVLPQIFPKFIALMGGRGHFWGRPSKTFYLT